MSDPNGARHVIEMRPKTNDEGEIVYHASSPGPSKKPSDWLGRVAGIALGFGVFLLLLFFFFYVVLPVVAAIIVFVLLKKLFSQKR